MPILKVGKVILKIQGTRSRHWLCHSNSPHKETFLNLLTNTCKNGSSVDNLLSREIKQNAKCDCEENLRAD